jgi:predicted house-cleaning NTP pyrophosphatase (Maf/HAM1 superfamily)
VVEPQVDEGQMSGRPERVARRLAAAKARAVRGERPDAAVLAADTVVAYHGLLLGKPTNADEARAMLRRLRLWRTHRVITAVAVLPPARRRPLIDHATTYVTMRRYTDDEIAASIARGDPFDKAGAYAIQDERLAPVARYDALPGPSVGRPVGPGGRTLPVDRRGCYCNVMGLPLWTAIRLLGRAGLDVAAVRVADLLPECEGCPLLVP